MSAFRPTEPSQQIVVTSGAFSLLQFLTPFRAESPFWAKAVKPFHDRGESLDETD